MWRSEWGASRCGSPSGRPASILYQPLIRGGLVLGVLVVGWPDSVRAEGPRATIAALLAHEAAAAIDRADAMEQLADEAQTDALTGLPNRRAWDVHLDRAVVEHQQWAIAMLDFDHFKEYNDTFGHPAGDRLLKETAAGWRDRLRNGDILARLGGEEFGLLLLDCDPRQRRRGHRASALPRSPRPHLFGRDRSSPTRRDPGGGHRPRRPGALPGQGGGAPAQPAQHRGPARACGAGSVLRRRRRLSGAGRVSRRWPTCCAPAG